MSITDLAPAVVGERLFPTCAPWCQWHYAEDTPEEPGCCWATDVEIPGTVEVMATWDERRVRTVRDYIADPDEEIDEHTEYVATEEPLPPLLITVFRASVALDEGIEFASLEAAEASAHAILAMVARLRGDEQLAQVHLSAGVTVAQPEAGAR